MISAVSYQFEKFVRFAEERVKAGKDTAIARKGDVTFGEGTALEERNIYATDKTDFVGMTILRGGDTKRANDEVRELFRKSIVDMFGGEGNIPDSVKDAMLLKDYGCGKPLTARRILEVYKAIDALDRVNIFVGDLDHELSDMAIAAGYTNLDFGKLNMAANFLMKKMHMDAKAALAEVVEKGSAANRAMNAGSMYMKDADSFMRAYDVFTLFVSCDKNNLKVASESGSKEATKNLASIADNLAYKYKTMLKLAEDFRAAAKLPENALHNMQNHFNSAAEEMAKLQSDISSGKLTDRKAIYKALFNNDVHAYFSNMVHVDLERALGEAGKRTPAVDALIKHLKWLADDLKEEQDKLAAAYRNALAEPAKLKLIAAANEGGMATGTSGELPVEVLDGLGEFLVDDPDGNGAKIDKLCTYLENNGPAALRIKPGKKVDFKEILAFATSKLDT